MTDTALQVYKIGHLPVLGEWFALSLIEAAGSQRIGDPVFNEIFHPVAVQLIDHCDAVLRIGGHLPVQMKWPEPAKQKANESLMTCLKSL
jgi:hypothetical protein